MLAIAWGIMKISEIITASHSEAGKKELISTLSLKIGISKNAYELMQN